ncbi:E3 ubiquitin-protein ligase PUB24-like [Silene latifolia]|uniref:E3 ubiquitin-protein ligase PUB24-like n=1 Tax=Silene latifolia TaxID=37657 RepID=UPI003D7885A4
MCDLDQEVEIPQYFLCPISLQIMKDPVTTVTGITYDRENIDQWLKEAVDPVCPVTKQPLSCDSDLTPNHTLRRLIQAWCVVNARHGVERIPTPRAALTRTHIVKILRGLTVPRLQSAALDQLLAIATSDGLVNDRRVMAESGVVKAMVSYIIKCSKETKTTSFLEKALRVVNAVWTPTSTEVVKCVSENYELLDSITSILNKNSCFNNTTRNLAVIFMKDVVKVASSSLAEQLSPEFFEGVIKILRSRGEINEGDFAGPIKGALRILLEVCPHGRNRYKIIEANAIFELLELELELNLAQTEKKKITELIFCLLAQLCSCAEGRAQFMAHSGGIAVVSEKILKVSPVVDDRAVHILALISKCSATKEALQEMLKVGAVYTLCIVLQADCAKYLKDKVREILRVHSYVWNNSPCIQFNYVLTRYPLMQF